MRRPKTPIQYFGNKSAISYEIWKRFGNVDRYIDPFCGSMSILLARPYEFDAKKLEIVSDMDSTLVNFLRALKHDPVRLAKESRNITRSSLEAWTWANSIQKNRQQLFDKLFSDRNYYDLELGAGYLFLNSNQLIKSYLGGNQGEVNGKMEKVYSGNHPEGFKKSMINVTNKIMYALGEDEQIEYYQWLSVRLKNVIVLCGDWEIAVGSDTMLIGNTDADGRFVGIVFDPPYEGDNHDMELYTTYHEGIGEKVRNRAIELGKDKRFRIALCGYVEEHDKHIPSDWERLAWTAGVGFSALRKSGDNDNRKRETIWFSPACKTVHKIEKILVQTKGLFDE